MASIFSFSNILGGRESDVLVYRFAEVVGRILGWRGCLPLLIVWVLHSNRRRGGHLFCIVQFYRLPALKKIEIVCEKILSLFHTGPQYPLVVKKVKTAYLGQ